MKVHLMIKLDMKYMQHNLALEMSIVYACTVVCVCAKFLWCKFCKWLGCTLDNMLTSKIATPLARNIKS